MNKLLSLVLLVFSIGCQAQRIESENLLKDIQFLSSDDLQGRGTGSAGEAKAGDYIQKQLKALNLQPKGDNGSFLQNFVFKGGIHGTGTEGKANNIGAYLDNGAPTTVVIGAHYDHLGLGENGSSLDANPTGKIHNGADDNASGVAGVLELARYFQKNNIKEKNNFLFLFFSGEELGLIGSKYFTEHPSIDLTSANYMINLDMIGRLNPDTKNLYVSGTGTSPRWETLLKSYSNEKVKINTDSSGTGPSDHTSFYLKNIPALHFFTGAHSDYHKPTDDWEKVNVQGAKDVLEIIVKLIERLDEEPKLSFLTTKSKSMGSARSFKVTMGVMPSYSSDVAGLKVDGVTDGKPAQKAGIQTGDVIIQMGALAIKDIQNYMDALGKFEKGQTVPVKVKRNSEELIFNVTF